ncbi:MAG: hypothetical protein KIT16_24225 [Rhodospirillaceae bacterium]|nr:hypothetical protein [Rhodospirillaceae bacterium]
MQMRFRIAILASTLAAGVAAAALPAAAADPVAAYGPPVAVTYYYAPYGVRAPTPPSPPSTTTYFYGPSNHAGYAPASGDYYAMRPTPEAYYTPPGLSIATPLGVYAPLYGGYSSYSAPNVGGYEHYRTTPDR